MPFYYSELCSVVVSVHQSHRRDRTLVIQTSIMQAADNCQLLGHDEVRTQSPQFGKRAPQPFSHAWQQSEQKGWKRWVVFP